MDLIKKLVAPVLSVFLLSSCSWVFMTSPPKKYEPPASLNCSTSSATQILDLVFAGFGVYGTYSYLRQLDDSEGQTQDQENEIFLGAGASVVQALVHFASMGSGYSWASRCEELQQEQSNYVSSLAKREGGAAPMESRTPGEAAVSNAVEGAREMLDMCAHDAMVRGTIEIVLHVRNGVATLASVEYESKEFQECLTAAVSTMRFPKSRLPRRFAIPVEFKRKDDGLAGGVRRIRGMLDLCARRDGIVSATLDMIVTGGKAKLSNVDVDSLAFRECAAAAIASLQLGETEDSSVSLPLTFSHDAQVPPATHTDGPEASIDEQGAKPVVPQTDSTNDPENEE